MLKPAITTLTNTGEVAEVGGRPTVEQLEGFRLVAKRAIDANLELADELEAA